jgi:hypothetical protein
VSTKPWAAPSGRDPVLAIVTVIIGVIVGLTFPFRFANVLTLAIRLGAKGGSPRAWRQLWICR